MNAFIPNYLTEKSTKLAFSGLITAKTFFVRFGLPKTMLSLCKMLISSNSAKSLGKRRFCKMRQLSYTGALGLAYSGQLVYTRADVSN